MRILLTFFLFISLAANGSTYYVDPVLGNDLNPGTITQPFKTVGRLNTALHASDIAYLRGGTYTSTAGNAASWHFVVTGLTGTANSPILIQNYPGETPVFDLAAITPTNQYPYAFVVTASSYVTVKGLTIKNLKQISNGTGVSYGFAFIGTTNCTANLLNVYNIGGTGCTIQTSTNPTFLNCDSHHCGDGMSPDQWNFGDAFTCTGGDNSTGILFDGCRGYMCGDDIWDFFGWQGLLVTMKNCWAFYGSVKPWGISGTQPSDAAMTPVTPYLWAWTAGNSYRTSTTSGEGFKLGGCNMSPLTCFTGSTTQVRKYLIGCASFGNMGSGYRANFTNGSIYSHIMQFENCTAHNNGNDGYTGCCGQNAGLKQRFHNCFNYDNNHLESGADFAYDGLCDSIAYCKWPTFYEATPPCGSLGSVTISNADFVAVNNDSLAAGARQSDGSLPVITYLHLASGSDLIDAGINRGYVTYNGTAPDLGAFEYGAVPPTPVLPSANAGADKAIVLPTTSVAVTGTAGGSITPLTYLWTVTPAATITGSTTLTATFSGLSVGTYRVGFRVTDASSNTVIDSMIIVVSNTGVIIASPVIRLATLWQGHIILDFTYSGDKLMEVERSVGNGGYVRLGTVEAVKYVTGYGFVDWSPVTGSNSYRVRTGSTVSAVYVKKKP